MTQEDSSLGDFLGRSSAQRKLIKESPITRGVTELLEEINKKALDGKGNFAAILGDGPADTTFSLSWEGTHTKQQVYKTKMGPVFTSDPFHLNITPFIDGDDGFLHFRITARYEHKEDESKDVELGVTKSLNVEELKPLLEKQVDNIKQSSQR